MDGTVSHRNSAGFIVHCAIALLLLPLLAPPAPAQNAQQNGVAVWQLPTAKFAAMFNTVPPTDAARYDRLRQYFTEFGCTGNALIEQPIDKNGHRRNLICTLAGESGQQVIVTAWYNVRPIFSGGSTGWPEAVMLPILYNALSAQPRRLTFVFAAFDGADGEYSYFHNHHSDSAPPITLVVLNALGLSSPHIYMEPPDTMPAKSRSAASTVLDSAWRIGQLQGYTAGQFYIPLNAFPNPTVSASPPLGDPKGVPRITVFSTWSDTLSLYDFQRDHDFIAFFLGNLDKNFAAPPATTNTAHP
jgi:hypothetical protein